MTAPNAAVVPSSRPDLKLLRRLHKAHRACLIGAGSIATLVLFSWLVPAVGSVLPAVWSQMKANTAVAVLFTAAGMILTRGKRSRPRLLAGRVSAIVVLVLSVNALIEHLTGRSFGLDMVLADDSRSPRPGLMSIQTATFLALVGLTLVLEGSRHEAWRHLGDVLTIAQIVAVLVILGGFGFGATKLFGQSPYTRTSPQTLICMALLAFAGVVQRIDSGFFSVVAGLGIGSHFARIALPVATLLPFLLVRGGASLAAVGWLSPTYAAALTAAAVACLLFAFVVLAARRINDLERDLRDMSLMDELTRIQQPPRFLAARRTHDA